MAFNKNVNMKSEANKVNENSLICDDDEIPLIDSQDEAEEKSVVVDCLPERPKTVFKTQKTMHFTESVLDSPDIFHLRAPLVSCENILTPSMSQENIISR